MMAELLTSNVSGNLVITANSTTFIVSPNSFISLNAHSTQPTVVDSNTVALFGRAVASRMMPAFVGPSGLDSVLQPFLARNNASLWDWVGNATTTSLAFGMAAPTATGTATARTCNPTSIFQSLKRIGYVSAATAGANVAIRMGVNQFLLGNTAGMGGFTLIMRFGVSDPAVVPGAMMFCGLSNTSGQIAINPKTGQLVLDSIEEETKMVMENLKAVLKAADMTFETAVKVSIFISDMNNFAKINAVYGSYFSEATAPARETVEVACLPKNVNVEISMLAIK